MILAVDLLVDHLRLSHLQFVALAAHGLHQHREVKHASSAHNPLIRRVLEGLHVEGQVLLQFLLQSVVDMARGHEFTLLAEEWRVVDGKEHRHRGLVDSHTT